ncbi:RNA polymerase sigma factor [Subtercola lobariae]|uniref:RNA polymerase subunit sigma-24 n=1 Tax=Subtercola lobariae TaxID=1588641 RepID=A0A917ET83_9MICO|nr:hypothetical protein GCM10011399_00190 [Subtercola lobariae]
MSGAEATDAELLERAAADDRSALALLLRRHSAAVSRYAWALVGNQADVEEVVQDTFLTCWRKAGGILLPGQSVLPWLLVTCRNVSMNLNRARFRYSTDQLSDDILVTEPDNDARQRLRWVLDEIARLTPTDQRVSEMCLIEGRSYSEAADELGISIGAVRQRVSRSRARLRRAVTENEE